jgi:hypothetical protein
VLRRRRPVEPQPGDAAVRRMIGHGAPHHALNKVRCCRKGFGYQACRLGRGVGIVRPR